MKLPTFDDFNPCDLMKKPKDADAHWLPPRLARHLPENDEINHLNEQINTLFRRSMKYSYRGTIPIQKCESDSVLEYRTLDERNAIMSLEMDDIIVSYRARKEPLSWLYQIKEERPITMFTYFPLEVHTKSRSINVVGFLPKYYRGKVPHASEKYFQPLLSAIEKHYKYYLYEIDVPVDYDLCRGRPIVKPHHVRVTLNALLLTPIDWPTRQAQELKFFARAIPVPPAIRRAVLEVLKDGRCTIRQVRIAIDDPNLYRYLIAMIAKRELLVWEPHADPVELDDNAEIFISSMT